MEFARKVTEWALPGVLSSTVAHGKIAEENWRKQEAANAPGAVKQQP